MADDFIRLVNREGQIFRVDPKDAEYHMSRGGYSVATDEDLRRYKAEDDQLQTFAEGAGAGALDAATAIPRLWALEAEGITRGAEALGVPGAGVLAGELQSVREGLSGRQVMKSAAGLVEEFTGEGNVGAAEQAYSQGMQARAEVNPGAATAGYVAGQLPFALATPMARGGLGVAQAALEGGLYGVAGSDEGSFVRGIDAPASAEQMMADGALGALLGGGIGGAMFGAGRAVQRATSDLGADLARLTGDATDAAGAPYRTSAKPSLDDVAAVLQRSTGETPSPSTVQAVWDTHVAPALAAGSKYMAGSDDEFVTRALRSGADGDTIREVVRRGPEAVLSDARESMHRVATEYSESLSELTRVSRDMELKASTWRTLVPDELADTAVQQSRRRGAAATQELVDLDARLGRNVKGAEKRLWNQIRDDASTFFTRAASGVEDAGEAMAALDSGKRLLQKHVTRLRKDAVGLSRSGKSGAAQFKSELAAALEGTQETTRKMLEDPAVWGRAGEAQKRINSAWSAKLDPEQAANRGFSRMFERTGTDYQTGQGVFRVREDGVESFLRKVGRKEGGQEYQDLIRQLDADKELVDAIGGAVGRESPEFAKFASSVDELRKTVDGVKERGTIANQLDLVRQATGLGGGISGAGVGYALGGAPGAALGGMLSRPDAMLRTAAALQATGRRVTERSNGHLSRLFARFDSRIPALQAAGGEVTKAARGAGRGVKKAAIPAAVRVFRGRRDEKSDRATYLEHSRRIRALASDDQTRHGAMQRVNAAMDIPAVTAQASAQQARAIQFLAGKIPPPDPQYGLTPQLYEPAPPPYEVETFARYYSATVDPFSALEDLERGQATPEQAEALRMVYPSLYQQLRQTVFRRMALATKPPPYEVRRQLDMFLDLGGKAEPSMDPTFLAGVQASPEPEPPPSPTGGGGTDAAERYDLGHLSTLNEGTNV